MENHTLIAAFLGVLVLVSMVQAYQLNTMKNTVTGGAVVQTASQNAPASSSSPGPTGGALAQVPASLQNLPDMVGGC